MGKIEIILSTGNIVSAGPSILRKPGPSPSNREFTSSLQSHFEAAKKDYAAVAKNGGRQTTDVWTARDGSTLYVPRIEWETGGLHEDDDQYDITVKLFFLPSAPVEERAEYTKSAVDLVLKELNVHTIDLLIASFPGLSFDGDCEWEADTQNGMQGNDEEEVATWALLEGLHSKGVVKNLGISEFGTEKLQNFINRIAVRPTVDQINIRDCCKVPPLLVELAKKERVELLVHTDCTDILPCGTLRELLGPPPRGAGVVSEHVDPGSNAQQDINPTPGLKGELTPQWVVKYTAVVRNRGVVENKGYFAGAALCNG